MKGRAGQFKVLFPYPFAVGLLLVSLCTNCILVVRLRYPQVWDSFQEKLHAAPSVRSDDHIRGNLAAKFTVIEYTDFQCPFCSEFHAEMRRALRESDTRWILRHRPISQIHPMAIPAAEAAECAAAQGRFWEYADKVFENQEALADDELLGLAGQVGLNEKEFELCVRGGTYSALVKRAAQEADRLRINGTPTSFINGKRIDGLLPYEQMKALLK